MKRRWLRMAAALTAVFLIGALAACGPAAEEEKEPIPPKVAALADRETDVDVLVALDDQVTREDLGITVDIAPYKFQEILRVLIALDLRPIQDGDGELAVRKPFTLRFGYEGEEYSYAFSQEKIVANGVDYFPNNPAALEELYEDEEYEGVLTKDLYRLREDMDFSLEEVEAVEFHCGSMAGEENYRFTDPASIETAVNDLGNMVVWKLDPSDPPNPKTGGSLTIAFRLKDGASWRYESVIPQSVNRQGGKTLYGEVTNSDGGLSTLLGGGLSLQIELAGEQLSALQANLEYGGTVKQSTYSQGYSALDLLSWDGSLVVQPGVETNCRLAFLDEGGAALTPESLSVHLYQEDGETGKRVEIPAPAFTGGAMELPKTSGWYAVQLQAEFPEGWAEYWFSYRVSDLPGYFWDIEYGNNEGDVLFTRDGITVPGGQNRPYVDFILSLGLSIPEGEVSPQSLEVKKEFTMAFTREGEAHVFAFTVQGITLDGKNCAIAHPERVAKLYEPLTQDNAVLGSHDLVDYGLRGFLTKEVSTFSQAYPISPEEIASVTVIEEKPREYTQYDAVENLAQDLSWMDEIILAKEWSEEDHYWPRRFYLSYRITCKDGTVYELGEQLQKDGEETGWYLVYTDLPQVKELIKGLEGETVTREERLPAVLTIDDAGNITFS